MFCTPTNCPEIIQLVEVDAPLSRVPCSSASSSSSYWWSSSDGTDENETEIEEDEKKDEGYCESYCSSDDEDEAIDSNDPSMNRVLAWRSSFDSVYGADEGALHVVAPDFALTSRPDVFQSLKRKYGASEDLSYDSDSSVCWPIFCAPCH